jgi:hypothetical protein
VQTLLRALRTAMIIAATITGLACALNTAAGHAMTAIPYGLLCGLCLLALRLRTADNRTI